MTVRVLVTGARGQLGGYLVREAGQRGLTLTAWGHSCGGRLFGTDLRPVDLTDADGLAAAFRDARPDVVLHAAAVASVADCARDPDRAERVNARGSALLAELADRAGARLVLVSTDLVFDGERGGYTEQDPPSPLSVYGRSKVAAERAVLAFPHHAVVRVSLLFGPSLTDRPGFFDGQVESLRAGRPLRLFADEWRTPLGLTTAARALVTVAESNFAGLLHLGGPERMTRLEMGRRLAARLGLDGSAIVPTSREAAGTSEPRPRDTSLDSSRWRGLFPAEPWPSFEEAVGEMMGS